MAGVYSVGQINAYIKNMFQSDFLLSHVTVKGEVSNCKDHTTGHLYFTLKDEDAAISVVMFRGSRVKGLKCRLREGMKVRVTGSVSVYEKGGSYQIYATEITEDGVGDLFRQFQLLKEKLSEMGMFSEEYKKPIPKYARRIGIVTSDTGAALHDILQIANRRNPHVELILCPALVQGERAAESIVSAIERLDRLHLDVMIVGRGGGSIEDLWCFNDERVARAVFDCDTPVISAVGHEVDFTIIDFVADHRAPTPSAAAEIAVFDYRAFVQELEDSKRHMALLLERRIQNKKNRLMAAEMKLRMKHPKTRLQEMQQRLMIADETMNSRMREKMSEARSHLKLSTGRLNALSPLLKLVNGYGYVTGDGKPLKSVQDVEKGSLLKVRLHDGEIVSRVESTREEHISGA